MKSFDQMKENIDNETDQKRGNLSPACLILDPFVLALVGKVCVQNHHEANHEFIEDLEIILPSRQVWF